LCFPLHVKIDLPGRERLAITDNLIFIKQPVIIKTIETAIFLGDKMQNIQSATVEQKTPKRVSSVMDIVLMLNDDELWEFVCQMLPDGTDIEMLEDVYDVLLCKKRENEEAVPLKQVVVRMPK